MDRGTFHRGAPSSDPFYVLQAKDARTGKMVQLAKSKHINKNLNPQWEAVEVDAQQLANVQELQIEVWDHDTGAPQPKEKLTTPPVCLATAAVPACSHALWWRRVPAQSPRTT